MKIAKKTHTEHCTSQKNKRKKSFVVLLHCDTQSDKNETLVCCCYWLLLYLFIQVDLFFPTPNSTTQTHKRHIKLKNYAWGQIAPIKRIFLWHDSFILQHFCFNFNNPMQKCHQLNHLFLIVCFSFFLFFSRPGARCCFVLIFNYVLYLI